MVRLVTRGALGVLLAGLSTACLGGQTGEPASAQCPGDIEYSATDPWEDTTVEAAASSFEGTYVARLVWRQQEPSSAEQAPLALDDELELTIDYHYADAVEKPCSPGLRVPLVVTLSSSESGIAEAHEAELSITRSAGHLSGRLHYLSERVELDVTLSEIAEGARLSGNLDALDAGLPGAAAEVVELP